MGSFLRLMRLSRLRNAYLFRGFVVWAGLRVVLAFLGNLGVSAVAIVLVALQVPVILEWIVL